MFIRFDTIHEREKIAVFTYRSPHFCFPWRRPCDYHAICCMDEKAIECLPNPSQHVPIYLTFFNLPRPTAATAATATTTATA